MNYGDNN